MMTTPTIAKPSTTRPLALTGKGQAAALLIRVQQHWDDFTPAQRHECELILGRLAACLRREHSVANRVPLVGRIAS